MFRTMTGAPAVAAGQREQIPEESTAVDSGKPSNEINSPVQTYQNDKQSPAMVSKTNIGGLENQSPGSIQSPSDPNGSLAPRGGKSDNDKVEDGGNTAAAGGQSRQQMKKQLNLLKDSPATEPAPGNTTYIKISFEFLY